MASGEARALHAKNGLPVMIVGAHGRAMWSEVFEGAPYILRPRRFNGGRFQRLVSGGGVRPYIAQKTPTKWMWREYKPKPAEIFFTDAERAFAEPFRGMVMLEPEVKNIGHDNKAWPLSRWVELAATFGINAAVQCVPPDATRTLPPNVLKVATPTFRHAAAVLAVSKAFVGTDGGLMHAAAAVGTPAVILWSEFTSPAICGYATMTNIRHAGKPCGNRLQCKGCHEAMSKITVDEVSAALKGLL
ncbi:MAG: glycosyltransferase family 9 protein [Pyrinomonadaceae bacterium]